MKTDCWSAKLLAGMRVAGSCVFLCGGSCYWSKNGIIIGNKLIQAVKIPRSATEEADGAGYGRAAIPLRRVLYRSKNWKKLETIGAHFQDSPTEETDGVIVGMLCWREEGK